MIQLFKKHLINYCVFLFSGVFVAYILLITKTNIGSWFYFFIVLINYFTLSYIVNNPHLRGGGL
jgi:hypothetical protein